MAREFTFRESDHTYWLGEEQLPSVTQIIDSHGLVNEFSKQEWAALRGNYAHEACRYLFEGRLDFSSLDTRIHGYVLSLQSWLGLTGFCAEACEVRLYHPLLRFAGTYDVKGYLPNGTRLLIDLKSGVSEQWHHWQTAGYMILEGGYRQRGALYLQKDGSTAEFEAHNDENDATMFISFLNTYRVKELCK